MISISRARETAGIALAAALFLTTCAGSLPGAVGARYVGDDTDAPATMPVVPVVDRVAGTDRFATAVAVSQATFPAQASAVVLARADAFADALVGAPLSAAKNGPLLLTSGASLPSETQAEITRVLPAGGTVYVLGGVASIPASVTSELTAMGYATTRYAGADRFGTALAVAAALGNPTTALLADGDTFDDALVAGPAAAHVHAALLLTDGTTLPAADAAYLTTHAGTAYAIGATAAAADPSAISVFGTSSPSSTSIAVATRFFTAPTVVGIASSAAFPDALAGGAQTAHAAGPLLLQAPGAVDPQLTSYLTRNSTTIAATHIYGGVASVSDATLNATRGALGLANPSANAADLGTTPLRCSYVVGYDINVSALTTPTGAPNVFAQQSAIAVIHAAVADLGSRTGQTYRYDGLTTFVPTMSNYSHGPDDLVITIVDPANTDFYATAPAGEHFGGYTRWALDGSGTSAVAIAPAMASLPSGLSDAGGVSLYAITQHELGHSVGLQHSPNPTDIMYFQTNAQTPAVYSAADTALLAASACRS